MRDWSNDEVASVHEAQRKYFDALQDHIEDAEATHKIIFVKEHVTFINDPMHPTFLIRHPAMMLPSLLRTFDDSKGKDAAWNGRTEPHEIEMTTKWFRAMYDFYVDQFGEGSQWPVAIDADDIMRSPEFVVKYARITGLDPSKLKFSWEKASEEQLNKFPTLAVKILRTLNGSSGVDISKVAGDIDIAEEAVKWRAEFGEELGCKLEGWVRNAMPDYEYMYSRRLKLD
ncbi:hypothetical protein GGR57DRAFT_497052 [Xylariaceae sp. FL1272]|nr:hypothetical protein GGR57DRAFT_497052 [Xylariaceae sp. FL1272]